MDHNLQGSFSQASAAVLSWWRFCPWGHLAMSGTLGCHNWKGDAASIEQETLGVPLSILQSGDNPHRAQNATWGKSQNLSLVR